MTLNDATASGSRLFNNANGFTINNSVFMNNQSQDNSMSSPLIQAASAPVLPQNNTGAPLYLDEPISLNASEIYARLLLPQKRGYALWKPKPGNWLPEAYRKEGVRIGDVGILTEFGEFDYFFNACLPADHPVNRDRVPQDFKPFRDIDINNTWSDQDMPGSFVSNNDSHFHYRRISGDSQISGVPTEFGAGLSFMSRKSKGALLILPEGAIRIRHPQDAKFRKYAAECARSWHNHVADVNGPFARTLDGLYIVTGCDKARAWGVASFFDASGDVALDFVPKQQPAPISGSPEYLFSRHQYASALSDADTEFRNQSGCVFLRGFKIAVRFPHFIPKIGVEVRHMSTLNADEILPKPTGFKFNPSPFAQRFKPMRGLGKLPSNPVYGDNLPVDDEIGPAEFDDDFSSGKYQVYHPSDVINRWILKNNDEVDVAIMHDNDWEYILKEHEQEIPNNQELIHRISKHIELVKAEGLTYTAFLEDNQMTKQIEEHLEAFPLSRLGEYTVIEEIAEGTSAVVKKAIHTVTKHTVAMKYIPKTKILNPIDRDRVKKEYLSMKLLKHPHIIKLYEVIHTPDHLIFVLEYAPGELFDYIVQNGRIPEPRARLLFQQLISAIEYSHRLKIVHRDIKPENILLDDDLNVKIADFGLSNVIRDGYFLSTSCGSPNYASPEVISGAAYAGPEVDVWSAGVILYVMLCGNLPFEDDDVTLLFRKILDGAYSLPSFISPQARSLINAMLTIDSLKRITVPEIIEHPFFLKDLPQYLSPLPPKPSPMSGFEIIPGFGRVEEVVVDALDSIITDVTKDDIMACLRRNDEPGGNVVKVAYMLLRDQRRMGKDLSFELEPNAEHIASDPPSLNLPSESSPIGLDPSDASLVEPQDFKDHDDELEDTVGSYPEVNKFAVLDSSLPANPLSPNVTAKRSGTLDGKQRHRQRWYFGIRSRSPPMEILLELYKTLKAMGMEWLEKKTLGGLGGVDTRVVMRGENGVPKIEREKRLDGPGDVDLQKARGVYLIETRARVQDVVVLINIQLYFIDATSYMIDFHHKRSYRASTQPGAGKFDMAAPRHPRAESKMEGAKEEKVVSPYAFMDIISRLILELAGGGE